MIFPLYTRTCDSRINITLLRYEFSLAIIDICSTLETWPKSEARGIKYKLPCGKFADYTLQIQDMLLLLQNRPFGHVCVQAINKLGCEQLDPARPAKQIVKEASATCNALLRLEDLVAAHLVGPYLGIYTVR